jgi:molybdenum cofactor cytidylyltransferase
LSPETICRLSALDDVMATIVEADGSRERPLKAPARHEPAVPPCATHVLTVAGMRAVNRPLDAATVHRPEIAAELAGLRMGDSLAPEAVAAMLAHPAGGLKGHHPGRASYLYLNLAADASDSPSEVEARLTWAQRIAGIVLARPMVYPAYQAVMIGSAHAAEPVDEVHGRVAGVVLAAGRSSRVAGDVPKQLLPWADGGTLVGHAVDQALASRLLTSVSVITGYQGGQVADALRHRRVTLVNNPSWAAGQSSSVHAAVRALPPDVSAVVFLLADQPGVPCETIDQLVQAHRRTLAPIVAPVYRNGQRGNPVLFDRSVFPELLALQGDTGGRPVIERHSAAVHIVPLDVPQPRGIETIEEYWRRRAGG